MTPMEVLARGGELARRGIPPFRCRGFDLTTDGVMLLGQKTPGTESSGPGDSDNIRAYFDADTPITMPLHRLRNLAPLTVDECPCQGREVQFEWGVGPCPFCPGDGEVLRPFSNRDVIAIDGAYFDARYLALAARHLLTDPARRSAASSTQALVMRDADGARLAAVMPRMAPRPDVDRVVLTIEGEGLA